MAFCSWLSARVAGSWYGEAKTHDVPLSRTRDPRYSVRLPTPEIWDVAAFGRSTPYAVAGAEGTTRLRPGVNGRQAQIHQMKHCPAGRQDADLRTNALGVVDLFGNVWEWCISSTNLNHFSAIIAISGGSASHFGDVEPATVEIRGGGYLDDLSMIHPSARAVELQDQLETRHSDLGFRIAVSLDPTLLSEEIQEALAEHAIYVTADAYTHVASGQ